MCMKYRKMCGDTSLIATYGVNLNASGKECNRLRSILTQHAWENRSSVTSPFSTFCAWPWVQATHHPTLETPHNDYQGFDVVA